MYASSTGLEGHYDGYNEHLEGWLDTAWGGIKKAGGIVAKQVVPTAISFVPIVGGAASQAYRGAVASGAQAAPGTTAIPRTAGSRWGRAARAAIQRAREDPGIQERVVSTTAQYASPALLAAAAARQARDAPTAVKAATLIPALALAALFLARRK